MREYKFRGKRVDNGEWVEGYFYKENMAEVGYVEWGDENAYDIVHMIKSHYGDNFKDYEVDPNTVGQYTGLKEKNGVEIFEGDKIVVDKTYPFFDNKKENYIGVVEWVFSSWQYILKCVNEEKVGISNGINCELNECGFEEGENSYYRVIGNIHEVEV